MKSFYFLHNKIVAVSKFLLRKKCSKCKCVTDDKILDYSWSNNCHSEYHQDPGDDIDGIQSVAGPEGEY